MDTLFSGIILGIGIFIGYKGAQKAEPYISQWLEEVTANSQKE